jgi:Protein of unknown function (DUF3795)
MKNQTRKEFLKNCLWLTLSGLSFPHALSAWGAAGQKTKEASDKKNAPAEKMIAYCGITCTECPAYIATQKNDDQLRAETAKKWSEMFKASIKPEDINCDGCAADSERLFSQVRVCEIRKCTKGKNLQNCAYCADYPCSKLTELFSFVPEAKATLDEIRKKNK